MKTPERLSALRAARQTIRVCDQKIARIKSRLNSITASKGIAIGPELSDEVETVIKEKSSEIEVLPFFFFFFLILIFPGRPHQHCWSAVVPWYKKSQYNNNKRQNKTKYTNIIIGDKTQFII